MKQYWNEFREEYLFYFVATFIVVISIATLVFWVTLPIALCVLTKTLWWLLLYFAIIPGIFAALVATQGGVPVD